MKEPMESKFDYRIDQRTRMNQYVQSRELKNESMVKSPGELANKYEKKLVGPPNVMQYSD